MIKKKAAKKAVRSIPERKDKLVKQVEKKLIRNDHLDSGKAEISLPVAPIHPISPPPPQRAVQPEQKKEVIQALLDAWLKFPYLRLGQLVCLAADTTSSFYIEDAVLKAELLNFKHEIIRCDSLSQSRSMQCTLEYGHDGDRHFNHLAGMAWHRF